VIRTSNATIAPVKKDDKKPIRKWFMSKVYLKKEKAEKESPFGVTCSHFPDIL
jgi:hypothetical protein